VHKRPSARSGADHGEPWWDTSWASSPPTRHLQGAPRGIAKVEACRRRHPEGRAQNTMQVDLQNCAKRAHFPPQKCRLVAEVVRGQAGRPMRSQTLRFMPKEGRAAGTQGTRVRGSANAEHNSTAADIDELKSSAHPGGCGSRRSSRFARPAAKGRGARASSRRKHSHHPSAVSDGKKGLSRMGSGRSIPIGIRPRDHPRLDQPLVWPASGSFPLQVHTDFRVARVPQAAGSPRPR